MIVSSLVISAYQQDAPDGNIRDIAEMSIDNNKYWYSDRHYVTV